MRRILCCVLFMLCTACVLNTDKVSPKYRYTIYQKQDDFSPDTIEYFTKHITITGFLASPIIDLALCYHKDNTERDMGYYYAKVIVIGSEYLPCSELSFVSGANIYRFDSGYDIGDTQLVDTTFITTAMFIISDEAIDSIKINGISKLRILSQYKHDKVFSKENNRVLREFIMFIEDKTDIADINTQGDK